MEYHEHCALVLDTQSNLTRLWAVYEHLVSNAEGEPPQTILIGVCRMYQVHNLTDAKTNSKWLEMFKDGGKVLVRIVATTNDRADAQRHAANLIHKMKPVCNVHGYSLKSRHGKIRCVTNGKDYPSQTEASIDLGIHCSSISRHLRGLAEHAQGFKFEYVD